MRAARDEGHIDTGERQLGTEIAADPAGAECDDPLRQIPRQVSAAQARWMRWQASSSTSVDKA